MEWITVGGFSQTYPALVENVLEMESFPIDLPLLLMHGQYDRTGSIK